MSLSDSGWDSDDWEDNESSSSSSVVPKKPKDTIESVGMPVIDRPALQKIPTSLEILNLVSNGPTLNLYRCEPAKQMYVGIRSDKLRTWPNYLLQILNIILEVVRKLTELPTTLVIIWNTILSNLFLILILSILSGVSYTIFNYDQYVLMSLDSFYRCNVTPFVNNILLVLLYSHTRNQTLRV